ncbi:MAG: Nif3-like dinuclear metal center hexameric protein, partial [Planctomycetota bacterium]
LGDSSGSVERIQCCLTLTPASVKEAIDKRAELVITHHPLPFKALSKITSSSGPGKMLWDLACHGCAIYAPHTAWDSAPLGINALLADKIGLAEVRAIIPAEDPQLAGLGAGRIGVYDEPKFLDEILNALHDLPGLRPRAVLPNKEIKSVAICCGSGGSLLGKSIQEDCDLFLTGEATFHTCLEAEAANVSMLMLGHYASERFAMEHLASELNSQFATVEIWASEMETDPVENLHLT